MRNLRLSAENLKRLAALENKKKARLNVALFPVILPVEEWGELAVQYQAILKDNIKKDCAPDYGDLPKLELISSR